MECSKSSLLGLPLELRRQIYSYLLELPASLIIRSLFIRSGYRNVFMSQQRKDVHLNVLTVCKQITTEALPLLYAIPLWKCGCRFEGLATQIGSNFGLIRRMEIDVDDMGIVSTMVGFNRRVREGEVSESRMDGLHVLLGVRWLSFDKLEELIVEGYSATALREVCSRGVRLEAKRLCEQAQRILQNHPSLRTLVEKQRTIGDDGGSDARDLTFRRVRWRFLRNAAARKDDEAAVDIKSHIQLIGGLLEAQAESTEQSSLPRWMANGQFSQYPYLVMQATADVAT